MISFSFISVSRTFIGVRNYCRKFYDVLWDGVLSSSKRG